MAKKINISQISRKYHRDLGYFVIGLTIIYALSGIVLSFRDLHLFEKEYLLTQTIEKNLQEENVKTKLLSLYNKKYLQDTLENKDLVKKANINKITSITKNEDTIVFQIDRKKHNKKITYYKNSGEMIYSFSNYPAFVKVFIDAHKSSSGDKWVYLALAYSVILLFLAISAIFMMKGKYGFRQRGIYFTLAGIAVIAFFLYL